MEALPEWPESGAATEIICGETEICGIFGEGRVPSLGELIEVVDEHDHIYGGEYVVTHIRTRFLRGDYGNDRQQNLVFVEKVK